MCKSLEKKRIGPKGTMKKKKKKNWNEPLRPGAFGGREKKKKKR